jgi:hypothetical protein
MSAAALAAVSVPGRKACELSVKGRYARAAEKFADAAIAAQALGITDCLITAMLHVLECDVLKRLLHSQTLRVLPVAQQLAALYRYHELMSKSISTLQRRRTAGTLLPGALLPLEEAWSGMWLKHRAELRLPHADQSAAAFLGYETFLYAGAVATIIDSRAVENGLELARFVATAADVLVQRPLVAGCDYLLGGEISFVSNLQQAVQGDFGLFSVAVSQVLSGALCILRRDAAERVRAVEAHGARHEAEYVAHATQVMAEQTATVLCCALEACAAQEAHPKHFNRCSACRAVCYCCREHQVEDWPVHKAACKAARKAAAEQGAGSGDT